MLNYSQKHISILYSWIFNMHLIYQKLVNDMHLICKEVVNTLSLNHKTCYYT